MTICITNSNLTLDFTLQNIENKSSKALNNIINGYHIQELFQFFVHHVNN